MNWNMSFEAEEVAAEIRNNGGRAFAHQANVSDEEQVRSMFQKVFREFGTIDILGNNAGLQRDAPFDGIKGHYLSDFSSEPFC
jgi:glucose 1-dehydrogenase